jgi:hypothetical protein
MAVMGQDRDRLPLLVIRVGLGHSGFPGFPMKLEHNGSFPGTHAAEVTPEMEVHASHRIRMPNCIILGIVHIPIG